MGGRGSSSGISGASPKQLRLMNNLVKRNAKEATRGGFPSQNLRKIKMVQ